MLEKNPYETDKPVDVPSFMSKNDDSIDMSKIILNNDELEEDDDYDFDDRPRFKLKKEYILPAIVGGVGLTVVIILAIFLITTSGKYSKLVKEYESYKQTADTKIAKYETEIANNTKSITSLQDQLKTANEEIESLKTSSNVEKKDDSSSEDTPTSTTELKAGTYYSRGNYIRTGTSFDDDIVDVDTLPTNLYEITNNNGTIISGQAFTVLEVVETGTNTYWGRIGDGLWVCLRNSGSDYVNY